MRWRRRKSDVQGCGQHSVIDRIVPRLLMYWFH